MDFKKIIELSNKINYFEDVEFHSYVSEDTLLIKNKSNDSIWKINHRYEEDKVVFDTTKAEVVQEQENSNVIELKDITKDIATKSVIEGDKTIYETAKQLILEKYDFKKKKKKKKEADVMEKKNTDVFESLSKDAKKIITSFYEKYQKDISENKKILQNFLSDSAFMFEEEGNAIKKEIFVDPEFILECYKTKIKKRETFFENVNRFAEFETKVKVIFEEREIPSESISVLFEGLEISSDIGSKVTKSLLAVKKAQKLDINISETTKEIKEAYSEIFADYTEELKAYQETEGFGDLAFKLAPKRYGYLRMNPSDMDKDQVKDILGEINEALTCLHSLDEAEFKKLIHLRQIVETCYSTGQIDYSIIMGAVNAFNETFIKNVLVTATSITVPLVA